MFTKYTYEDWKNAPEDKHDLIQKVITAYKSSTDFSHALLAQQYFLSDNVAIRQKFVVQLDAQEVKTPIADGLADPVTGEPAMEVKTVTEKVRVPGTRLSSSFLFRFVTQENQHLLGNGVTLKGAEKKKLGTAFDTVLSAMGEHALVDGCCWGFWNNDHLEEIRAVNDGLSGAVALVDEKTSQPMVLIQFWQLESQKPQYVRVFEPDGLSWYKSAKDGKLELEEPKRAYKNTYMSDAIGKTLIASENYPALPVVPLYANPEHRSEFTEAIKSKIDCFDRIVSDFGDNLEMANDVYWALNNFGGTDRQVLAILSKIRELRTVVNYSDGTGSGSTAEPHSFQVPYEARKVALEILRRELYRDAMALDIETLSGASLSTEAIETASKELNLKCDRFEWQVFDFVQRILALLNVETEVISFKRQNIINTSQVIENIYRAAEDLDQRTRLEMNPMVADDKIDDIIKATAAERTTGLPDVKTLEEEMRRMKEHDDGTGQS